MIGSFQQESRSPAPSFATSGGSRQGADGRGSRPPAVGGHCLSVREVFGRVRCAILALLLPAASGVVAAEAEAAAAIRVVFAPQKRAVLSAQITAPVRRLGRDFGETFVADDVLVELDPAACQEARDRAEAQVQVAQARAEAAETNARERSQMRKAEAALAVAEADGKATERLYKDNTSSQLELERARGRLAAARADLSLAAVAAQAELATSRAELAMARAGLACARRELDACVLRAPHPGKVVKVFVREHELVQKGQPLIEIVDDRVLHAQALLPSRLLGNIRPGQEARVAVQETGVEVPAVIRRISAELDPASETFEIHAEVANSDGVLRAGMIGRLILARGSGSSP